MRTVLIRSDGSPAGTHIFDASGHEIEAFVTKIEWHIEPEGIAEAVVTFANVALEAQGRVVYRFDGLND